MKKKTIKKKSPKKVARAKALIISVVTVGIIFALLLTMTIWSSIVGTSPIALAKSLFVKPAAYNGTNLFNAGEKETLAEGGFVYAPIALKKNANYVVTVYADSTEGFDFEGAINYILFSNTILDVSELEMLDIMALKDVEIVMFFTMPMPLKFSTTQYDYAYMTLLSMVDWAVEGLGMQLKVEEGINSTTYSDFGKGSATTYNWRTLLEEPNEVEPAEPTAIAAGDTIEHLFLNTSDEGSAILQSLTTFSEATAITSYPADIELKNAGHYANIIFAGGEDFRVLALAQGPDSEQVITLLWCSADGFDLTELGLSGTSVAGWQEAAQGDLAANYGFAGYVIQAVDGDTIKYTEWANGGDAVAGKATVDSLFSSTPWA